MQLHPDTTRTLGSESLKSAVTIAAAIVGLSFDTWIKVATLGGILLSAAYTAWKWHRDWRRAKRQDAAAP